MILSITDRILVQWIFFPKLVVVREWVLRGLHSRGYNMKLWLKWDGNCYLHLIKIYFLHVLNWNFFLFVKHVKIVYISTLFCGYMGLRFLYVKWQCFICWKTFKQSHICMPCDMSKSIGGTYSLNRVNILLVKSTTTRFYEKIKHTNQA